MDHRGWFTGEDFSRVQLIREQYDDGKSSCGSSWLVKFYWRRLCRVQLIKEQYWIQWWLSRTAYKRAILNTMMENILHGPIVVGLLAKTFVACDIKQPPTSNQLSSNKQRAPIASRRAQFCYDLIVSSTYYSAINYARFSVPLSYFRAITLLIC